MKKKTVLILLCCIILLGGLLRFYRIRELGTFLADQAIELEDTWKITQGNFTLIGIKTSNSEVRNGAVMYYLLAPLLIIFGGDPIAGGILQSFFSLAGVVVAYLIGKKAQNEYTGLLAAFFIATSPLIVRYSRQTMLAQYPLFFCGLAVLLLMHLYQHFSRWNTFLLGILVGFMLQIHYATFSVMVACMIFPFIFLKNAKKTYLLFLIIGIVIGFMPMIIFELRHEFFNSHMLLGLIQQRQSVLYPSISAYVSYFAMVISDLFFPSKKYIGYIGILLFIVYVIWFRAKLKIVEKISVLFIFSSVMFVIVIGKDLVVHYAIAAFIPVAVITASLLYRITNYFSLSYQMVFVTSAVIFILMNFPSYGFADNHGWMMSEGWNLIGTQKAAEIISTDVSTFAWEKQYNLTMLVDAQTQGVPLRYFLKQRQKAPLSVEYYDKPDYLYVVSLQDADVRNSSLWEITSFGAFEIEKSWPVQNNYFLYRLGKKHL